MTGRKKRVYLRLLLGVMVGLVLLSCVSVLYFHPIQSWIVHRLLESVNQGLNGRLEVESVRLLPTGAFDIAGARLTSRGAVPAYAGIVQVERISGRLRIFSLLVHSLDFDSLRIEGLQTEITMDSMGRFGFEDVFAKPSPEKPTAKPAEPWRVHIRQLEISAEALAVREDEQLFFQTNSLRIESGLSYEPRELILHHFALETEGIRLRGSGSWPLAESGHGAGCVHARLPLQMLSPFLEWKPPNDTVSVDLHYELKDSLGIQLALDWPQAGVVAVTAKTAWPVERVAGLARGSFFGLRPDYFADTVMAQAWLSGSFDIRGDGPPLETAGISAHISLHNSSYDNYEIRRADFDFVWRDQSLSGAGEIHSKSGSAKMTFRADDLLAELPRIEGTLDVREVCLQDFAEDVPSDIPRINARIHGWMRGAPPFGKEGAVEASFGPTSFRGHAIDTARVEAEWRGKALTFPQLYAAHKGTSVEVMGEGAFDSTFQIHAEIQSRDIRELAAKLPIPEDLADSLAGAVQLSADAKFKLSAAGPSEFEAKAELEGESVAAGPCSFRRLAVSVDTFRFSPLFVAGSIYGEGGEVAGRAADTVMVRFSGRPESVAANLSASLAHDSLRLQLKGVFEQDNNGALAANLNILRGEVLGYHWALEKPTSLTWDGNELSMADFDLNSDLGAIRAVGRLSVKEEEDFAVLISDLRSGALAKLLPVPDAKISALLQLSGTGQAPTVNFELVAESLQWDENGWIDKLVATGELHGDSLSVSGFAVWMRDTLLTFSGNAPATLSFSEGLKLPRDKPLTARLRFHGQPLTKLQPYLPWGVRIGGWAGVDLNISGTMEQPVWNGDLVIENGSIEDIVHGLHYEDIYLKGNWRGDSLFIERAEAKATGKMEGQGMALMAFPLPESLSVRLNFKHFQILNRADLRAKLSGNIALQGPPMALRMQGNLTLDELRYRITSATTKDIELVDLEAELAELRGDTAIAFRFPGDLIYKKMDQAVRVKLPRNCWIHGGGVSIELEGDVWLYKQPNQTEQVYGQIRVVRGTVDLYTRKLEVQEGTITFDGDLQDPNLDITAIEANLKRSRNVEIVLKLGGTKNHPEIELSGRDPDGDLTYEDIVSYLTLGRRATGATEMFSSGAGSSETPMLGTAAVTGVSAGVSRLVSRALRLEVFEYRPGQGGVAGLTQGELEVGAYVTSNLFVSVIHSMEEKQAGQKVILEYQVLPWLRLRGTRQSEGQSGFDLFFQWEWR